MNRAERRQKERGRVIPGWTKHASPKQLRRGYGWFSELDRVYRKNVGTVVCMMRDLETDWGKVTHLTITTAVSKPTWAEKQQYKNELFGKEALAVEVFPPENKLVDREDMFHLWILHDITLPFGLHGEE